MTYTTPDRVTRLRLPERAAALGSSVRAAERELEAGPSASSLLDLTYADTHRFPPPSWALEDMVGAASGHANAYTPYRGAGEVRERLAPSLERFLGVAVDPERNLVLTPGSQAGLFCVLSVLVNEGDRVLLADPDYLTNERILRFFGAEIERIPLVSDDGDARLSMEHLQAGIAAGARVLVFSNPNNPTGCVYSAQAISDIARAAVEADVTVVVDELYSRLVYDDMPFAHIVAEPGMTERCVTLLGPSKTESMSGFRLGAVTGPPEILDAVEDVISIAALRAPAYAQHALCRWMADDADFIAERIADYQRLRDIGLARLRDLPFITVQRPAGTSYMFPSVRALGVSDQELAQRLRHEAGLVVNPGYQFGLNGRGAFRLCFAQDEEAWDGALSRITATLERLAATRA